MKAALIYLGRRGAGPTFCMDVARSLLLHMDVQVFLSASVENRAAWNASGVMTQFFSVFNDGLDAASATLSGRRLATISTAVQAYGPDVLIFPMFHPWNPLLQQRLADIPALVFVHDPQPHPGPSNQILRLWEDRSLAQADRLLIFSQRLLGAIQERGFDPQRTAVVPLPIHIDAEPVHSDPPPNPFQPVDFLFIGRITAYKGLDILLEAFRTLQLSQPEASLRIAGSGSLAPFQRSLQALQHVDVVNTWIADADILVYVRAARVVVLPYTSATQSGIIPLAASAAVPVIATQTGGLPEQIQAGVSGLLVPPGDSAALAVALQDLYGDPQRCQRLGLALQADFRNNKSWEHVAQTLVQLSAQVVEERARGKLQ